MTALFRFLIQPFGCSIYSSVAADKSAWVSFVCPAHVLANKSTSSLQRNFTATLPFDSIPPCTAAPGAVQGSCFFLFCCCSLLVPFRKEKKVKARMNVFIKIFDTTGAASSRRPVRGRHTTQTALRTKSTRRHLLAGVRFILQLNTAALHPNLVFEYVLCCLDRTQNCR